MARHFVVTADGGSRGNPGAAAYGAVVYENDKVVKEIAHPLVRHQIMLLNTAD